MITRSTCLTLLTFAFAPALAAAQADTQRPPAETQRSEADEAVATAVGRALQDNKRVNALKIKVAAERGVVTLTGDATDVAEKDAAEDVVRRVAGVRDVQNKLVVTTPGQPEPGTSAIPEVPAPRR